MNIIIFGPPLAGKGTQSKKTVAEFGLTHLSTGDVLRAEKQKKTELGIKASEYSSKGLLVPDYLVAKIVTQFYYDHKSDKGILFDGYPRNIEQAKHLLDVIKKNNDSINKVIFLNVPKDKLFNRAIKRAKEENRKDDSDNNIVLTRINEFENTTVPAINFIKDLGIKTITINGNQDINDIYNIIKDELRKS